MDAPLDFTPDSVIAETKITAEPGGDRDVFIGIAPTARVRDYLRGVEHATVTCMNEGEPVLRHHDGAAPDVAPDRADIWTAQSAGAGAQSVVWSPTNGDWTVVVMNADGGADVAVDARAGLRVPALEWLIGILLVLAFESFLVGAVLIAVPLRAVSRGVARS